MSRDFNRLNVNRRQFLVGAGSIAATGYLVVGKASNEAPTRNSQPTKIDYTVIFDTGSGNIVPIANPPVPNAAYLSVLANQVIEWQAKTPGSKHHLAVLFVDDTPFVYKDGTTKVYAFHGSEADEANHIGIDASIASTVSEGDVYEYCVGVWDEDNKKTYTADPTIIIGGHQAENIARAKLIAAEALLRKAAAVFPKESKNIKVIETRVETIIGRLKKQ